MMRVIFEFKKPARLEQQTVIAQPTPAPLTRNPAPAAVSTPESSVQASDAAGNQALPDDLLDFFQSQFGQELVERTFDS